MRKLFLTMALIFGITTFVFAADGRNPTIYNKTLTTANTEYSQVITPGTKKITVQCRTNYAVRIAYETGKVAGSTAPYFTMKSGAVYWEDNLAATMDNPVTIYLASSQAGVIVEILVWR